MIHDGCPTEYTGLGHDGLAFGDQGHVLVAEGTYAHVQWKTGACAGQVIAVDMRDLTEVGRRPQGVEAALDDSLEVAGLGTFTARQVFDEGGPEALLNAMVDAGHLSAFSAIAEEALALVTGRIRTTDGIRSVVSHLDESEADEVVRLAAAALIRDAFNPD